MPTRTLTDLSKHIYRSKSCCTTFTSYIDTRLPNNYKLLVTPCKCNSYFCKRCATAKGNSLRNRLHNAVKGKELYFITLTLWDKCHSKTLAIKNINYYFSKFKQSLKRSGYNFEYIKVLEWHKSSYPHLHLITTQWLPEPLIRKHWRKYTHSFIVKDSGQINNWKAINYVCKYVSKSCSYIHNKMYYINRKRRYNFSKNFEYKSCKIKFWKYLGYPCDTVKECIELSIRRFKYLFCINDWESVVSLELLE